MPASNAIELFKQFWRRNTGLFWVIVVSSMLLNVLAFAGSLYMLLVYDMILPSKSLPTLLSLFAMLAGVYAFQVFFENLRSRALSLAARRLHRDVSPRVHYAISNRQLERGAMPGDGMQVLRDLDQVYSYMSSAGPAALIDLPWVIVFLGVLTALHIWLGVAALVAVIMIGTIAWVSNRKTRVGSSNLSQVTSERQRRVQAEIRFAETARALGMADRMQGRTEELSEEFLDTQSNLSGIISRYGSAGRVFRMFVQSLVLTIGALLVLDGQASGGIIIASSILAGRALAPVDQAIGNLRAMVAASSGWQRIYLTIAETAPAGSRATELALPSKDLTLSDVWVVPPGATDPVVEAVSFRLEAGEALAILGPSAAGKTSLAKAIIGVWAPRRGEIRLDGAPHSQWDRDRLGQAFGYLPQTVDIVGGTIAQNISRFDPDATSEAIIEAAQAAGLHEMILAMPNGYDTSLSDGASELSAGQRQRVGLARALYGNPFLLVLDEANSNLDANGDSALARAITVHRERGGISIVITHRPATLQPMTHVAVMNNHRIVDFGLRDDVLKRTLKSVGEQPAQVTVG
ncbi:type I secretion system permease/ATPase [Tsuneonella mangrovi]|uniref:type I secretion system permease/ATPase n=1 Tax=Tsuneonella mangrovi TaxID=1982042 RepID=UPI000BA2579E|nr:type I secretion system permease/ATPase [Tsuneonella mangrovi]